MIKTTIQRSRVERSVPGGNAKRGLAFQGGTRSVKESILNKPLNLGGEAAGESPTGEIGPDGPTQSPSNDDDFSASRVLGDQEKKDSDAASDADSEKANANSSNAKML